MWRGRALKTKSTVLPLWWTPQKSQLTPKAWAPHLNSSESTSVTWVSHRHMFTQSLTLKVVLLELADFCYIKSRLLLIILRIKPEFQEKVEMWRLQMLFWDKTPQRFKTPYVDELVKKYKDDGERCIRSERQQRKLSKCLSLEQMNWAQSLKDSHCLCKSSSQQCVSVL